MLQTYLPSWENLTLAYHNAARGKRGRSEVGKFELYLGDNLLQLQNELRDQTYLPGKYHSFYIHEPKRRLISAAPFRDRVAHHALCNLTIPGFERRFVYHSYANRVGKGTHRAIDYAQKCARRYRFVMQCDLVQFFPSIDHAILRRDLGKMLADNSLFWLIDRILASGESVLSEEYTMVYFPGDDLFAAQRPRGLPIGNLTSQWWANCYLNAFDHFIKRELKCCAYLRYVDDFLLFSNSKQELWAWRKALVAFLAEYRLTIHDNKAFPRPVTEGFPFLGFNIYPEFRRLKRCRGIAYQRKLKNLIQKGDEEHIQSSIRGWINFVRYADTYGLRKSILDHYDLLAGEIDV